MTRPQPLHSPVHDLRLDALRGCAVLAVVIYHYYGGSFGTDALPWSDYWRDPSGAPSRSWWFLYPLSYGWAGVSLFFVLSGYRIHSSYLKDPQFTWRKYASKRFWRIYPAYVLVLVVTAAAQGQLRTTSFAAHLLLIQDCRHAWFFDIVPAFWSLAVEAHLYLLYPLALWFRSRWGSAGMLRVSFTAAIIWWVVAAAVYDWPGPFSYAPWWAAVPLWPSWLIGAWLAERHQTHQFGYRRPLQIAALSAVAAALCTLFKPTYAVASFTLAAVASAGVVDWVMRKPRPVTLPIRALAVVGVCSYSLYLTHQQLILPYLSQFPIRWLAWFVGLPVFLLIMLALSLALRLAVEAPGERLGAWLRRSRPTTPPTTKAP